MRKFSSLLFTNLVRINVEEFELVVSTAELVAAPEVQVLGREGEEDTGADDFSFSFTDTGWLLMLLELGVLWKKKKGQIMILVSLNFKPV